MLKTLILRLLNFTRIPSLIVSALELQNLIQCNNQVLNRGGHFLQKANVTNLSGKVSNIVIGKETVVCANLLVFSYGGKIILGENTYVGEGTRIWSGASITVGNNVLISHNVNIMDSNAHEIDYLERMDSYLDFKKNGHPKEIGSVQASPITIDDHVWIGFNATILKGVSIGRGAIIAAGTIIVKDVPPFVMMGGNPARILKHLTS